MKANRLGLIISLSAIVVAFSCDINNESPFDGKGVEEGLDDLYLYNVNTKVTVMITSSPDNFEWSYSFSPDSKKILFIDDFGINEMNLDGSESKLLMAGGSSPCYSPDGSKIAFTDEKKLYLMNVDGTNKTQIVDTDIGLEYPAWSKDGANIACSSDSGLCIVDLEGNLKICHAGNSAEGYEWSYDSKDIFYGRDAYSSVQIFRYNIMQDKEFQISNNDQFNYSPRCNPVTNEIVFTSFRFDYSRNLVIANQDGSDPRVILNKNQISAPCWSPNGDKIAFITTDINLAVIDRNGENYKIINVFPEACMEPKWSNDGKYILYCRALFYM